MARGYASLSDHGSRQAFIHTLRAVIDPRGQRVSARDRLYLASEMPALILWGTNDPIIPVEHGEAAHEEMPGSRFQAFEGAGHFPQLEEPRTFVKALERFIASTEPARIEVDQLRDRLLEGADGAGPQQRPRLAEAKASGG
jgi:pimeloyl-ACP methyl ester carboxylesterase